MRDFQLGLGSLMRAMFQRTPELVDETDEFLRATALNIQVHGPEALFVQTNMAELRGDLDFSLRGTAADPVILGSVTFDRGSEISFGGNDYRIQRGELTFSNPFRNDPEIDLVATATVREFDVRLNLFGPFDQLETSLSSSPPMPNLDIVSLLTTGSTDALGSFGSDRSVVEDGSRGGAEAFLASQAASIAGQRVGSLFGLDQVQISPITQGSASLSAARITVGKRISRDVYVTYSYDPSSSDEQIVEVAWRITPHLSVIITETDNDSVSFDLRWNNSF